MFNQFSAGSTWGASKDGPGVENTYKIAGIDVHKSMLAVVISDVAQQGEFVFQRRKFGTAASELLPLSAWLAEQGVREAIMESTAQYWRPVWQQLEGQCVNCTWHKRSRTEPHEAASGISQMPSDWCGGTWPENWF